MVVYGDLLFLINFSMDFLCFYISCWLLHQKPPIARMCIASCFGGAYSVLSLFLALDKGMALLIDITVLILMCFTVYLKNGVVFIRLLKGIFLYFFVSALLGGLMTSLFSFFNRIEMFASDMGMGEGIDVWVFSLLAIVGSLIALRGGRIFRSSSSKRMVELEIRSEMGEVKLSALVDSGNLAFEPISGKSAVIVSIEKCKKIIDETTYNSLLYNSNIDETPLEILSKIRIIPIQSLSGKSYLPALKFKKVSVNLGKRKKELDVYIAFVSGEYLGEYDAIISDETIV